MTWGEMGHCLIQLIMGFKRVYVKYKRRHEDYLCQHADMYVALGSWLGERLDMQRGGRVMLQLSGMVVLMTTLRYNYFVNRAYCCFVNNVASGLFGGSYCLLL